MAVATCLRFAIAGLLGAALDFLAFRLLQGLGFDLATSHVASFVLAAIYTYSLFAWWERAVGASPALWRPRASPNTEREWRGWAATSRMFPSEI